MAQANTLKIFETLRPVFDEEHATKIAEAVELALEENNKVLLDKVATKEDLKNMEFKIEQVKSDIIKWMFIFWVGQFAVIVGTLSIFFSLLKK